MRVAVTSAVYNEEKNIARFLEALLAQSRKPDEIVLVDDGSRDRTALVIQEYASKHPSIRCLSQTNRGPAAARNAAWRSASADVCVFTDGDCVPDSNWLEKLLPPFSESDVGAAAGTYRTLNPNKLLARFIGLEIAWRYRNIRGEVDAHGSYNLAVRRELLEVLGGFKEDYPYPSGEDWDLTYKISSKAKIRYVPEAVVGHTHPESLVWYLKNQIRRAFDRIRVYRDHPEKTARDTYTGSLTKYLVAASGLSIPALFAAPFSSAASWAAGTLILFLFAGALIPFPFFLVRDPAVAFFSLPVQMLRFYAWFWGVLAGILRCEFLVPGSRRPS